MVHLHYTRRWCRRAPRLVSKGGTIIALLRHGPRVSSGLVITILGKTGRFLVVKTFNGKTDTGLALSLGVGSTPLTV